MFLSFTGPPRGGINKLSDLKFPVLSLGFDTVCGRSLDPWSDGTRPTRKTVEPGKAQRSINPEAQAPANPPLST